MLFKQIPAQEVAVFVRFEVGGAIGDGFAIEGHGEEGKPLGQGLDIVFLSVAVAAGTNDAVYFLRHGLEGQTAL